MEKSNLTKEDIIHLIRESQAKLIRLGIKSIGIFGSFVRDDTSLSSDVDILVEFDSKKKTFDNFIDTCFFLEDLFNRKVEVVTKESISPYIKPYILKEIEYVPLSH